MGGPICYLGYVVYLLLFKCSAFSLVLVKSVYWFASSGFFFRLNYWTQEKDDLVKYIWSGQAIQNFLSEIFFCGYENSEVRNLENIQRICSLRTRMRDWTRRRRRSMGKPCVGHVERTMHLMSFGFVVTYARSGFMASAWRSLLPGLSTSSNTNARHAATRELGLERIDGWLIASCIFL